LVLPAHHCYTIMSATPAEQHAAEHETSTLNGSAANVAPVISEKEKVVDAEAAPPPPPPAAFDVPDGGLEAWSVVLGGWLVLFSTFGYVNAFGVYEDYYVQELGQSPSAIAWIGSFQTFLQFACGLVTGKIFDEGHGRLLMLVGAIIYVFALFMTSLCREFWQIFLAQGVAGGLGLGLLFLPAISTIPQWFKRRRALATGIVVSGSSIGGVVFPIMMNHLFKSIGYASAVRASTYLILGCLAIALLLVKQRIPGRKHRPAHMQFPAPDIKAILRHKAYWLTIAGGFLIMWGLFFPLFYLQLFAQSHGINPELAFYTLSIANAASVVGRVLPNFLADKFGVFNMLIAASTGSGVIILCWLPATNTAGVIVFSILFGFFSGAYVSLTPGCFAALSSHVGEMGFRLGVAWAIIAFAALTGTPISGALLGDKVFTWWKPTVWSGVVTLAGSVLLVIARGMHAKSVGKSKV